MNAFSDTSAVAITVREVPDSERLAILPRHFGRQMMAVENAVYSAMRYLADSYTGGYWRYLELSNGGFLMVPISAAWFDILVNSNGFRGRMSAEAAGITACLFAYSRLSFRITDERLESHFHRLRDYALNHAEARAILAAID